MLKKTIQYKDLEGNILVEDFYFHLNQAEVAEMQISAAGGLDARMRSLLESDDRREMVKTFRELIGSTVGRKSPDGKSFIKSQEIRDSFMYSEAYVTLFMEIFQDPAYMVEFLKGVVDSELSAKIDANEILKKAGAATQNPVFEVSLQAPVGELAAQKIETPKKLEDYTPDELVQMPYEQFDHLTRNADMTRVSKDVLVLAMQRRNAQK